MVTPFKPAKEESLCIEVTTHCNSSCMQCFVQTSIPEQTSLSLKAVKAIIAEGYASGFRRLHLTGGEPLLWGGLFASLDYAFEQGYRKVSMNTNGCLLTAPISCKLAAYKALSISISLDGPEEIHDRFRSKNSYRQAVAGIENALEAAIDLKIFSIVRKSLMPALPHFANDLFNKFCGIRYLTLIQLIRTNKDIFPLPEELLGADDFIKLVQTVSLLNLKGLKIRIKDNPLSNIAAGLMGMPWMPTSTPLYRNGSLMIRANGNISLSHSTGINFGKHKRGMIQKTMNSTEYQSAVAPDRLICTACCYRTVCRQNGLFRPLCSGMDSGNDAPFCKKVLDYITNGQCKNLLLHSKLCPVEI